MTRDELLRNIGLFAGCIEDVTSMLTDHPERVDVGILRMFVKGLRDDIDKIESYLKELERMDEMEDRDEQGTDRRENSANH